MTDKDYIAISNTGKNITITMTPGAKQRLLGDRDRIRLRFVRAANTIVIAPSGPGIGYQMIRRKNVWNMSVSSKRFQYWPKHERIVLNPSQVDMTEHGAIITLPTPSAPIPDKPIATPKKWLSGPILNQIEPLKKPNEPAMRAEYINLAGEYFEVQVESEDHDRFWKAYLRTLEKTEASHLFKTADMVVAAITGACFGSLVALALSAAGVLS